MYNLGYGLLIIQIFLSFPNYGGRLMLSLSVWLSVLIELLYKHCGLDAKKVFNEVFILAPSYS